MSAASKAQQKAVAKYETENYDKFLIRTPKGKKDKIKGFADASHKSLNGYIKIDEKMERDEQKP